MQQDAQSPETSQRPVPVGPRAAAGPAWPERWLFDVLAVAAVVLVAALLYQRCRYYPEAGYDESAAVLGQSLRRGHFGNRIDSATQSPSRYHVMNCYPPAYYAASALVFSALGFGLEQARLVSVLFVAATAGLCYLGGRRLSGSAAGLAALACYLYVPLHVYVPVSRPDVAVPFFLLAAHLALLAGQRAGLSAKLFAAAGFLYALAVLSHFVALMAAPVVGLLVWWSVGLRFWRARAAYAWATGFAVPLALYALLLNKYLPWTVASLVSYRDVGAQANSGFLGLWFVRSTLTHFKMIGTYCPFVLRYLVPSAVLVLFLSLVWKRYRTRLASAGRATVLAFAGLFLLIGTYPNIGCYSYYTPPYLTLGALAAGLAAAALCPSGRIGQAAVCAALLGVVGFEAYVLRSKVREDIRSVKRIPLAVPLTWAGEFADQLSGPTIATPYWVFSPAGENVLCYGALEASDQGPRICQRLRDEAPEVPPISAFRAIILSQYDQAILVSLMAAANKRPGTAGTGRPQVHPLLTLVETGFVVSGIFRDGYRISANYEVLTRADGRTLPPWPRLAVSSARGPVELTVAPGATISVPLDLPLTPDGPLSPPGRVSVWSRRFALESVPGLEDRPLLVRVVMEPPDPGAPLPDCFAVAYDSLTEEQLARAGLQAEAARFVPLSPRSACGTLGLRLPTGEWGRDLLVTVPPARGKGVLAVYSFEPARVRRIELALPTPPDETPDASRKEALAQLASYLVRPSKFFDFMVVEHSKAVRVGETARVRLTGEYSGELVAWQNGRVVKQIRYRNTAEPGISFESPGLYGIEVWAEDETDARREVVVVNIEVR
ncbi:MAG TPA: glycosyltransferase family 39 protein [Gemmataceae bacterium]|nr:glycosyltransferase family 39 protein [Gemmataceae bacterium]